MLVTSVFLFLGWQDWMWAGSLGVVAVIWLVLPIMPRQSDPNHKVKLIGSRFSPAEDELDPGSLAESTAG